MSLTNSRALLIVSALIILAPAVQAGDLADNLPDGMSPSQMHQIMGEMKALALDKSRRQQAVSTAAPAANQTEFDVLWYDINIRVNDTTEILYGTVTIFAEAVINGLTEVEIDYSANMTIDGIVAPSGTLSSQSARWRSAQSGRSVPS